MYNIADMTLDELTRRALSAYFDSGGDELPSVTKLHRIKGKHYVTLRRAGKLLACYRVRNDGKLKRLIRLPDGL